MPTPDEIAAAKALLEEHENAIKTEFFAAKEAYRADPSDEAAKERYLAAVAALYPPDEAVSADVVIVPDVTAEG